MKRYLHFIVILIIIASTGNTHGEASYPSSDPKYRIAIEKGTVLKNFSMDPLLQDKILSLDPLHITKQDLRDILAHAPAPRIIKIHGGIHPVYLEMVSFSEFLIGMGYPEASVRAPEDGSYSYTCYGSSEKLAGLIAGFYEREGLRPMMVGHSQGGVQVVKVLHELAGSLAKEIAVRNPLTEEPEKRYTIIDPLSGQTRPVVGLTVPYASVVGAAGGLARIAPNQWNMLFRIRTVPDSVEDFTGFFKPLDLLGANTFGAASSNQYAANGKAHVRTVKLPITYNHYKYPDTRHLLQSQQALDWINAYVPSPEPESEPTFDLQLESSSANIIWAAEVWYSIKKHWCLELQRLIRAKRGLGERS